MNPCTLPGLEARPSHCADSYTLGDLGRRLVELPRHPVCAVVVPVVLSPAG